MLGAIERNKPSAVGAGIGEITAFGAEGTGSYGAAPPRYLRAEGETVIEVIRPNCQHRGHGGKSDSTDADTAANAIPARDATAPRSPSALRHLSPIS